jgi:pimeloyl-ACP methyl ester carboxylesterase
LSARVGCKPQARRIGRAATIIAACALAGVGCAWLRPARSPMAFEAHTPLGPGRAAGVIVLLPGFGDDPRDFADQGILRILAARAPDFDVVAADAHFGFYRKRLVVGELQQHVVGPLVARGYRRVWLAGVSMGGHGAVAYARSHPEGLTGLILLAPYMGPQPVVEEVRRAGGLCAWPPPAQFSEDGAGFARENFAWLRREVCGGGRLSLWLAVGHQDRLLAADTLLGERLPAARFRVFPGGHGWEVWTKALAEIAPQALRH